MIPVKFKEKLNVRHTVLPCMNVDDVSIYNQKNDKFLTVRKLPKKFGPNRPKNSPDGVPIHFDSKIEHDIFLLLNFEAEIEYVVEHPVKIEYQDDDGKDQTFIPYLLVKYSNQSSDQPAKKPLLIELKYKEEYAKDSRKIDTKCNAARIVCESENWDFKLILDTDINQDKIENIIFLQTYDIIEDRYAFDEKIVPIILRKIKQAKKSTPKKLLDSVTNSKTEYIDYLPYLWHLIRWEQIGADIDIPLTMSSKIWHKKKSN